MTSEEEIKKQCASYLRKLKSNALSRHHDVNITADDLYNRWKFQQGRCAFTGVPLVLHYRPFGTASLDRIDNAKHYEYGNIQWVHKSVNLMKGRLEQKEFIVICHAVTKHSPLLLR